MIHSNSYETQYSLLFSSLEFLGQGSPFYMQSIQWTIGRIKASMEHSELPGYLFLRNEKIWRLTGMKNMKSEAILADSP